MPTRCACHRTFFGAAARRFAHGATRRNLLRSERDEDVRLQRRSRCFRERWLGRYLTHDAQHAFLAVAGAGSAGETLAGYLVGSVEDPALAVRFGDLEYFKALSHLTARYPAHLHVNLASSWQGRGVGRALVEAFCQHVQGLSVPGVHLFTGRGMRNVRFYERAGFTEAGSVVWNGREIVMLVRDLR